MGVRVREVHGSWYVFISHQGKRKAKKIGPGPDGKRVADEAARLIAARLSLGDLGVLQEPEPGETFAAFAEAWLDGYARSLKRRTQENYRQVLRAHWIPTLGPLELADIGREEIRVVVTQQMRHGLQISTIRTNLDVLHACLTAAVDEGKIPTNPATRYGRSILRLPPIRRRHIRVFWPDEMDLLLRRAQARHPTNSYLVILLMSRTGLRVGEALTLQVDDLDLENRDLWVRRT